MALKRPRPSINQQKIDVIKQEMNFGRFIQQLPPDKRVMLDWPVLLSELIDAEGTIWHAKSDDHSYSMDDKHGGLKTRVRSDKGSIRLVIHSLGLGQEDAIDLALWVATNDSAPFVYFKYQPNCFSTLCLTPREGGLVDDMVFVYGNMTIELRHDDHDVLPVARALQSVMEKSVVANPESKLPSRPKISYVVTPARIKAGETFTVTATFGEEHKLDPKSFNVGKALLSDNIEYEKNLGGGVYKFTAKSAGPGTVAFSLLDKKTLWVFTDNVPLTIEQ